MDNDFELIPPEFLQSCDSVRNDKERCRISERFEHWRRHESVAGVTVIESDRDGISWQLFLDVKFYELSQWKYRLFAELVKLALEFVGRYHNIPGVEFSCSDAVIH
jgi:hypothetical protein